jgi:hypothetical protein
MGYEPRTRRKDPAHGEPSTMGVKHLRSRDSEVHVTGRPRMQTPPFEPPIADTAPADDVLTTYDRQHLVTYLRLLDAEADRASWQEVVRIVLHIDPAREPVRARHAWETHLARAHWMIEHGYRHLLTGGAAD